MAGPALGIGVVRDGVTPPSFGAERVAGGGHSRQRRTPVLGLLITLIVIGAIAGFVARLLVPGRDPMGCLATVVLGILGSFVGGFLGYLLFGKDLDEGALQPSGVLGSIVGAIIVLLIYRATSGSRRS
jgi:uncharacterized membrane protein YeaQ/YmgE (transglycosylase-associated protein family)